MTIPDATASLSRPGTGVWTFTDALDRQESIDFVRSVESLGYASVWLPETFGRDPFAHIAHLLAVTNRLTFATGIANIYNRHAGTMKQAAMTLAVQAPGRFALGLGVSHERTVERIRELEYTPPLARMSDYLDSYESSPYRGPVGVEPPRLLAALGPKMLELAAGRSAGAHTYSVTPSHTAAARKALGPNSLLCVEQKVILTTDKQAGLDVARTVLTMTSTLPNYRRRWRALGFTERQITELDVDFVTALVAVGDVETLQTRIEEHLAAGASQVCVQPIDPHGSPRPDMAALKELAAF